MRSLFAGIYFKIELFVPSVIPLFFQRYVGLLPAFKVVASNVTVSAGVY